MKPPILDLIKVGTGLSCTSRQNNFTVFLFFLIVELSESLDISKQLDGFGGGAGTLFLGSVGIIAPGKGGGLQTGGRNIPGGGGGGPFIALTTGDIVSSSESSRKSEKSRSQRWNSLFKQPCRNSSQCNSFSDIFIS